MKTALRMYLRQIILHPYQIAINHIGYAIGLASIILILFWVRDEAGYDRFHRNRDRIFRVNSVEIENSSNINTNSPFPLTSNMKEDFPEIEMQTRYWNESGIARIGDNYYREKDIYLVDKDFLKIFDVHFIRGNPEEALLNLNSLILTESRAKKYFGEMDPVGTSLAINDKDIFTITAIISDPPRNSYLQYKMLGNINLVPEYRLNSWYFAGQSFVMLREGVNFKDLNKKLEGYYSRFSNTIMFNPYLQKISEIYLNEYGKPGRIKYVRIFSVIALFILLMISLNNWNLSYVMILKRGKELSMRSVNGASMTNLIRQFMLEAFISISVSLILAVELVQLVWNIFNSIVGKDIELRIDPYILIVLAVIILTNIVISGFYPVIIARKGKRSGIYNSFSQHEIIQPKIRPVLTSIQISLSIIIIICTILVYKQLNYMRTKDLGFNSESIIYFPMNEVFRSKYELIKKELLQIPEVESVTASSTLPTEINWWISINWEGQTEDTPLELAYAMVDYDYFKTLNIELIDGRSFSEQIAGDDSISYMISELAMKQMEIKDPVGKRITMNHNEFPERFRDGRIIGVFKDIHFSSLRNPTNPLLIRMYKPWVQYIMVKCNPDPDRFIMTKISGVLMNITPGLENELYYLNSEFDRQYRQEIVTGKLLKGFSIISICIYLLGLIGLISSLAQNKTKEIGIRKVNGARTGGILIMLNKSFAKWVFAAFVAATPLAWYTMDRWLEKFAFKTDQSLWTYLIVAIFSLLITIVTVSLISLRASTRNPVETLRYE